MAMRRRWNGGDEQHRDASGASGQSRDKQGVVFRRAFAGRFFGSERGVHCSTAADGNRDGFRGFGGGRGSVGHRDLHSMGGFPALRGPPVRFLRPPTGVAHPAGGALRVGGRVGFRAQYRNAVGAPGADRNGRGDAATHRGWGSVGCHFPGQAGAGGNRNIGPCKGWFRRRPSRWLR